MTSWLKGKSKKEDRLTWNPYIHGYPKGPNKKFWDFPEEMIGRTFENYGKLYRVTGWVSQRDMSNRPWADWDEDDGIMTAVRIQQPEDKK